MRMTDLILALIIIGIASSCSKEPAGPEARNNIRSEDLQSPVLADPANKAGEIGPTKPMEPKPATQDEGKGQMASVNLAGMPPQNFGTIPVNELEAAFNYLALPQPPAGQSWHMFHARKNEMMSRYAFQSQLPPGFYDLMLGLITDTNMDIVTRAYAIQHASRGLYAGVSKDRRRQIELVLEQTAMEHRSCVGGTSLLAAHHLWQRHGVFGKDWLSVAVQQTLADSQADRATRATALRLAGMLGDEATVAEHASSKQALYGIEAATLKAAWRQVGLPGAPGCEPCF